jgi:hypothetical protein
MKADIALEPLTKNLRTCFRYDPPRGYRAGKARVSQLVEQFYDCSQERARGIVERLEKQGYMYATQGGTKARWRFDPHPIRRS